MNTSTGSPVGVAIRSGESDAGFNRMEQAMKNIQFAYAGLLLLLKPAVVDGRSAAAERLRILRPAHGGDQLHRRDRHRAS